MRKPLLEQYGGGEVSEEYGWKLLANAIIEQACYDYVHNPKERDYIEKWIKSEQFDILARDCLAVDALLKFLKEEAWKHDHGKELRKNSGYFGCILDDY